MLEHDLIRYGYVVLFAGTMVEGEAFLLAAAFLAHRGYFSLPIVLAVAAVANTAADQFYYQIARWRGQALFLRKAASDSRYERVRAWIDRRGSVLLFVSRFMYGFRIAIPAACGAAGMPQVRFAIVNVAGGVFWAVLVGLAGYAFGNALDVLLEDVRRYEWRIAAVLLVTVIATLSLRSHEVRSTLKMLRRPAQMSAEFALTLFAVAHRTGRLLLSHAHTRLAALVVTIGALNLASAIFHWHFLHLAAVAEALPLEVAHGSRALMLLAGLALIAVGRGLARRKRAACHIAIWATALSAVLHLGHHASIVRAGLSAAMALELYRERRRFQARSDPLRVQHAAVATPLLALALTVYGCAGVYELGGATGWVDALAITWKTALFQGVSGVPIDRTLVAFLWSVRLLAALSAAYLLAAALAPVALPPGSEADAEAVSTIAREHGIASISYFARQSDKRHLIVAGDTFIGYRVVGRVAIAAGDPVGPPDRIPNAIDSFVRTCATNDWIPVFYEVSWRYLEAYRRVGLRSFKVGEEAIIPLAGFVLQGGRIAKVRQALNKLERERPDLRVSEYRRNPPDPEIDEQLEEISEAWLRGKHGAEMGFNLGIFSVEDLGDKRTLIGIERDGFVSAFLTWLPYRGGRALVIDAMRRRPDAPPGTMELLIARSAEQFKQEGLEAISLAAAPLANVDETGAQSPYDRGVKLIFEHFSMVYGYRSLFQFKKKFNPTWEGRYLVFPRPDLLPRIAYALVAVHTGRGVPRLFRR